MTLVDRLAEAVRQFEAVAYDYQHVRHDTWMAAVYERHAAAVREAIPIVATATGTRPQPVAVHAGDSTHEPTDPPAA